MDWFLVMNILISIICIYLFGWANFYLFTYLGEAEINGEWKMCYMYHTLTIPARIVAFMVPMIGAFVCFACWGFWLDVIVNLV